MNKKKIAILFKEGYLSVAPSVLNLAIWLEKNDFLVDIIGDKPPKEFAPIGELPKNISIFSTNQFHQNFLVFTPKQETKKGIYAKLFSEKFREKFYIVRKSGFFENKILKSQFLCYKKLVVEKEVTNNYHRIFAFDIIPLVICGEQNLLKKTIYFSLEIYFKKDFLFGYAKKIKNLERKFHKGVLCTIIQDKFRLEELYKENKLKINQVPFIFVPNSPSSKLNITNSKIFHQMFNLPDDAKIILSAGMISNAVHSQDLVEAFSKINFNENVYLVLHERMKTDINSPFIKNLLAHANANVLLSLNPLPFDQIDNLFASCHVGIVLYNVSYGFNFSLISGASGKFAQFLKCGKPVIASNLPGFYDILDKNGAGISIDNLNQLKSSIETIIENYENYERQAKKCFEENYDFEKKISHIAPYI